MKHVISKKWPHLKALKAFLDVRRSNDHPLERRLRCELKVDDADIDGDFNVVEGRIMP